MTPIDMRPQLKAHLLRLASRKIDPVSPRQGLCAELRAYKVPIKLHLEVKQLMVQHPEWSGHLEYPVPHPFFEPKAGYQSALYKWRNDTYGNTRRDFCRFVGEKL